MLFETILGGRAVRLGQMLRLRATTKYSTLRHAYSPHSDGAL